MKSIQGANPTTVNLEWKEQSLRSIDTKVPFVLFCYVVLELTVRISMETRSHFKQGSKDPAVYA